MKTVIHRLRTTTTTYILSIGAEEYCGVAIICQSILIFFCLLEWTP